MSDAARTILEVQKVTRVFKDAGRELHILRGVDLTVRAGEAVAVTGASGSGKSTLLNLIGALDMPTSGSVRARFKDPEHATPLNGMSSAERNVLRLRWMGFVFQFHHLLGELRAWENVAMPLMIAGRSRSDARRAALSMLEEVGLADRVDHLPAKLSGGELQRVALARALINEPALVLADEPTGNLDEAMGRHVCDLLWRMTRERGRSLVIVTHERDIAEAADRTYRLHEGMLEEV